MEQISEELKQYILDEFNKHHKERLSQIRLEDVKGKYYFIPIRIDEVFDKVRYNVDEKRFDQLEISIAEGEVMGIPFRKTAVYCDKSRIAKIPIDIKIGEPSLIMRLKND